MMPPVVYALLGFVAALFRSRASLYLENLALRHQLAVYQQTVHHPRVRPSDRVFWTCLSRLWAGWQEALAFVQPRTILTWHHQRFRDYWRGLSQRGTPGRPAMAKEVRQLIRDMWQANPVWGSPRIVGELRKVGIEVTKSTVEKYGSSGSFVETILEKWEDSPRQFCEEGEPWNPVRESSSRP
jgi:putative transposase